MHLRILKSSFCFCLSLQLLWTFIAASPEEQQLSEIYLLKAHHFVGEADSSKNRTIQLDSSLFSNNTNITSFFMEMQLTVEGPIFEAAQIVFALNKKKALKFDTNSSNLLADYIDIGGFYLRKKFFYLSVPAEYLNDNDLFLTIYQNQINLQRISFELLIGIEHEKDNSAKKRCPFDCLGNGVCDNSLGTCNCRKGYFDFDCSRLALSLDHFKSQNINDTFVFNWNSTLTPKTRNSFYYLPVQSSMDNTLTLKIHSIAEKQTADLLVIFSTQQHQNGSAIMPQASYSLSPSQMKNEVQLQLLLKNSNSRELQIIQDSFIHNRLVSEIPIQRQLEVSQAIQSEQTNFSYYLIGFLQIDGDSIEDYSVTLSPKIKEIQSQSDLFLNIHVSTLIVSLFLVLILLVCLLIGLLMCLYRRNRVINQILKDINTKKNEKSQEMKTILSLMPEIIYDDKLRLNLQHGDTEEPTCSVCLCEFEKNDVLRETYCPHIFHSDCLQSWLLKSKNCPHCRNPLTSAAIKGRVKSPQRNKNKTPLFSFNDHNQDLHQISLKKNGSYIRQVDETPCEIDHSQLDNHNDINNNPEILNKQTSIPIEQINRISPTKSNLNLQKLPLTFTSIVNQIQLDQSSPQNHQIYPEIIPIDIMNIQAVTLMTDLHNVSIGDDTSKRHFRNRSSILSNGDNSIKDSIAQFQKKTNKNNHSRFRSYVPRKNSLTEE